MGHEDDEYLWTYPNGFMVYSAIKSLRFFKAESLNVALTSLLVTLDTGVDSIKLMLFCDKNEIEI